MATDKFQDLDMAVTWILEQAAGLNITPNSHPNPNQHRHLKHNERIVTSSYRMLDSLSYTVV